VTLAGLAALLLYAGWKYLPVFIQSRKVDEVLTSIRSEAAHLSWDRLNSREGEQLLERATREIVALGVDETDLQVYFAPDYRSVHADYTVELEYPLVGTTTLEFHREDKIPRPDP
jgi:hypothetical protein